MRLLWPLAAALPLALVSPAQAQVVISDDRTAPVSTSTANGGAPSDVEIAEEGSIAPSAPGAALTVDSDNDVTIEGQIQFEDVDDAVGVLVQGGVASEIVLTGGSIQLVEDVDAEDIDDDDDLDGPFALGARRYGVRIAGIEPLIGSVRLDEDSFISVEGNDSAALSLQAGLTGDLSVDGSISVVGDRSFGVVAGGVGGDVRIDASVGVTGEAASGLVLEGPVGGSVVIQSSISSTGYRYGTTTEQDDEPGEDDDDTIELDELDADDLLQGGPAVLIAGDVAGGVLVDTPPSDEDEDLDDEDGDGVEDDEEGTGVISLTGGAPALVLGPEAGSARLGLFGAGEDAYGLILRGTVTAAGLYDGVNAQAAVIGGRGGRILIEGGVKIEGSVSAVGAEADATGLRLGEGAIVPELRLDGLLTATSTGESVLDARALVIDPGASLSTLTLSGSLGATVNGEAGNATALIDRSGSLTRIETSGLIYGQVLATDDEDDIDDDNEDTDDETVTGRAIAADLRANSTGVVLIQTGVADGDDGDDDEDDPDEDEDGVDDADEPLILGDVLLGSGADRVELLNGRLEGALAFGAGRDRLVIDGGAEATGRLSDDDGQLDIEIRSGVLDVESVGDLRLSTLQVGADGELRLRIDPRAGANTRLLVSETAMLAEGAEIALRLESLLSESGRFELLRAGSLTAGQLASGAVENAPYLYVAELDVDEAAGVVAVDVRRRTAAEAGLSRAEAAAYDPAFAALTRDDDLAAPFLEAVDRDEFLGVYRQLLPDTSAGVFAAVQQGGMAVGRAAADPTAPKGRDGPNGLWLQEIVYAVRADRTETAGYRGDVLGLAGGFESIGPDGGAVGVSAAWWSAEVSDPDAAIGEAVVASVLEAGLYWRTRLGPLQVDAGGGLGLVRLDSERLFSAVDDEGEGYATQADADWSGLTGRARAGLGWEARAGRWVLRPQARVEYAWLREDGWSEDGGGDSFDLSVEERASHELTATASAALGARFGPDGLLAPELEIGWTTGLAGSLADTVARFRSGGDSFTLVAEEPDSGGLQARAALRAAGSMGSLTVEASGEQRGDASAYGVRLAARLFF
jgi:hypothetical protein